MIRGVSAGPQDAPGGDGYTGVCVGRSSSNAQFAVPWSLLIHSVLCMISVICSQLALRIVHGKSQM